MPAERQPDPGGVRIWPGDSLPPILERAGQVGIAASGILLSVLLASGYEVVPWWKAWPIWTFAGSAIAMLVGAIADHRRSKGISQLELENGELRQTLGTAFEQLESVTNDYFSIIDRCLRILANEFLNLDDTERISIYRHDGSAFVLLGRYSKHPDYRRRGRSVYADDEGCIGFAWRNGYAFVSALPDPETSLCEYLRVNEEQWQMPAHVTSELVMKSRSIAAFAMEDATGDRIAVIVFESTEADKLDFELLKAKVHAEPEGRFLASMIQDMKPHEPSPSLASRKGF